jgi:hypothetical protein
MRFPRLQPGDKLTAEVVNRLLEEVERLSGMTADASSGLELARTGGGPPSLRLNLPPAQTANAPVQVRALGADSILAVGCQSGDTTLWLTSGELFLAFGGSPQPPYYLLINYLPNPGPNFAEIVKVTAAGVTSSIEIGTYPYGFVVQRGQLGTTAKAFGAGQVCQMMVPLATGIGAADTSLTLAPPGSVTPFPGNQSCPFFAVVEFEIVKVTAVSGNTFTVQRGQFGTAAASHGSNAPVTLWTPFVNEINTPSFTLPGGTRQGVIETPQFSGSFFEGYTVGPTVWLAPDYKEVFGGAFNYRLFGGPLEWGTFYDAFPSGVTVGLPVYFTAGSTLAVEVSGPPDGQHAGRMTNVRLLRPNWQSGLGVLFHDQDDDACELHLLDASKTQKGAVNLDAVNVQSLGNGDKRVNGRLIATAVVAGPPQGAGPVSYVEVGSGSPANETFRVIYLPNIPGPNSSQPFPSGFFAGVNAGGIFSGTLVIGYYPNGCSGPTQSVSAAVVLPCTGAFDQGVGNVIGPATWGAFDGSGNPWGGMSVAGVSQLLCGTTTLSVISGLSVGAVTNQPPASAHPTSGQAGGNGSVGQMAVDTSYLYVCTQHATPFQTAVWGRLALDFAF